MYFLVHCIRRRFFRYSLRTLCLLMLIAAIGMGYMANRVRRQQAAVVELARFPVTVHYDHQHAALTPNQLAWRGSALAYNPHFWPSLQETQPAAPAWLRNLVGDDYFQTVTAVTLFTSDAAEIRAAAVHLRKLPHLKEVLILSPSCGNALQDYIRRVELIKQELPRVTVTGYVIPVVG